MIRRSGREGSKVVQERLHLQESSLNVKGGTVPHNVVLNQNKIGKKQKTKGGVAVQKPVKILALPRRGVGGLTPAKIFWWICHSAQRLT